MGYSIEALIGPATLADYLTKRYRIIRLPQNYLLVPLRDALKELKETYPDFEAGECDEMRPSFGKPPPSIIPILKEASFIAPIAYIESEYFGGYGDDFGIPWENGNKMSDGKQISINKCLEMIGVKVDEGMDEFASINLGKFRSTGG